MKETISVLIPEKDILKRVDEIAKEVAQDFKDEEITIICVLKGAVMLTMDLVRRIKQPLSYDFVEISSYHNSTESQELTITKPISIDIEGKNVLIVEDILDSGRTMDYLINELKTMNPKKLKLLTLLDKPERRKFNVTADYIGFEIPDEFVIGYGLDYAQKYRNLPYIGSLKLEI